MAVKNLINNLIKNKENEKDNKLFDDFDSFDGNFLPERTV